MRRLLEKAGRKQMSEQYSDLQLTTEEIKEMLTSYAKRNFNMSFEELLEAYRYKALDDCDYIEARSLIRLGGFDK